jgi:hypothetical protein
MTHRSLPCATCMAAGSGPKPLASLPLRNIFRPVCREGEFDRAVVDDLARDKSHDFVGDGFGFLAFRSTASASGWILPKFRSKLSNICIQSKLACIASKAARSM